MNATVVPTVEFGWRRFAIVAGVMCAALLQTLDSTIVNVALPTIEGNVGASIDDGAWIVTGYIISNVIVIPLAPYLLAVFGRRQYYAASIIGFTLASVLCGTATTLPLLVTYRIVQGIFGGGLIATSQLVLRETFPADKIGTSSGLFAIALTAGPALGPVLGGYLTDNYSWPWVFEINLVPGAIAALIMLTMLRNPHAPRRLPFDGAGVALLAAGLGSFQFVLDEGERYDWFSSPDIVLAVVVSAAGLIGFVVWELFGAKHPIVDLRALRAGNIGIGVLVAVLLGMVSFGPTIMMPQYVQASLAFTAMLSGQLMLMRALPVVLLTPLVANVAQKLDPRILIAAGSAISAVSLFAVSGVMTTTSDFGALAIPLILSGVGQAVVFVPLLVAVLTSVPPQRNATAGSFLSLSFNMGASISSAVLITIFDQRTYFHADIDRGAVTLNNPLFAHQGITQQAIATLGRLVNAQATNAGFADAMLALVPVSVAAIALLAFMRRRAPQPVKAT